MNNSPNKPATQRSPFSSVLQNMLSGEKHIPRERRVFVNRNLRMEYIQAIGFDMDHTLALYNRASFEQLTHDLAVDNLISWRGYSEEIRGIDYNPNSIIRGLVVDRRHGNLLKMDFHNYIARVYHGTRALDREARRRLYRRSRVNLRSERYQSFDTLFSMPEGSLYAALIDLREASPDSALAKSKPAQIFDDVRACVDKVHRDGSLKAIIMKDLPRYFVWDDQLAPTLLRFRAMGKKVFLLTNSEHAYTEAVMSYLLGQGAENWKDFFDLVIVESKKPAFFLDGRDFEAIPTPECPDREDFVFRGGSATGIEKKLGADGDQVLYFGDHTYGDILKSKKTVGWRTAMIVQELEGEVAANRRLLYKSRELGGLIARSQDLALDRDQLTFLLRAISRNGSAESGLDPSLQRIIKPFQVKELDSYFSLSLEERNLRRREMQEVLQGLHYLNDHYQRRIRDLELSISVGHNDNWGRLFREGNENSRFGRQVREFACIYTSRVSNFLGYSGNTYFIAPEELMPHER